MTNRFEKIRLILLPALVAGLLGFLLSDSTVHQPVHAFSAGPPAGYTAAPGEEPEACAECHVPPDAGTGQMSITAPQTYVPGQTYQITVTHTNADPTRRRWGFELTVLDTSDEKAGNLSSTDGLTQILDNAGPGSSRQYVEHSANGTFIGQQAGASWTFNWTAPPIDVGYVTFYSAGNHANNDGNTSGDYIYKTFVASAPASSTPDFVISAVPSSRSVTPGSSVQYEVTITPLAGFTGNVSLSANSLPTGAGAVFNPNPVNITNSSAKTSTVTINTGAGTPLGNHTVNLTGTAGPTVHSTPVMLNVISPASADISVSKTASPNPGQVGVNLTYRVAITNNGPATATSVNLTDQLPSGVTFGSSSTTQGACMGTGPVTCSLGSLAAGASAFVTIVISPTTPGQIANTATVSASESDFDSTNNAVTIQTLIQPAAGPPTILDPNLTVSTVASGLNQPTTMAFLGPNDFFVLERTTGKVQRIVNGVLHSTALDLAVNGASERGLLGIALHRNFANNGFVYLYWTESSTGADTLTTTEIPLLGNRVDRYIWNGSTLAFDRNLIRLRALQSDSGQTPAGNHNGGVLRFGPDGKVYIIIGDEGRRGLLQNITSGGPVPDDQFGGPEPDDAHLTGVILRLNDDGSTPSDNPFFNVSSGLTGEAAANVKKIFAYGVRNSFGMAFDPLTGNLWTQENGDDAFDEINRVRAGFNGGWIQAMGPINRVAEFKSIEMTYGNGRLQQLRWPPSNIADTPQQALARLYMLPGAQYTDPEFSWKFAVAPSPIGFVQGRGLGAQFEGDLFVGASRTTLHNGFLFRFRLTNDRQHFSFTDPRLADLVADNTDKFDVTESESLLIGRDFGVTTDIQTGPNGNLYVVSLSNGAIYEIKSKPSLIFTATLNGMQEVPPNNSTATGTATLVLSPDEKTARVSLNFSGLSTAETDAHIHGPAPPGVSASAIFPLPLGQVSDFQVTFANASQVLDLKNGLHYVNVHSSMFPTGEIRGQFGQSASANAVGFSAANTTVNEGEANVNIMVTRLGNTNGAATVGYATSDISGLTNCNVLNGSASSRCDYATAIGTVSLAAGETFKSFSIPIVDDAYAESAEAFTINLNSPTGATLGPPTTLTVTINDNETVNGPNPVDQTAFFVRQHYIDFLGREPDPPGFAGWHAVINNCPPGDTTCDRVHVSSAFFRSPEFQERGYFVYRFYSVSFGRKPDFAEFIPDLARVSGFLSTAELEAAKVAFINDFIARPGFVSRYNGLDNTQYVDTLLATAGVTLSNRQALIEALNTGMKTRAEVLREIVESSEVFNNYFNQAFVVMQYFGYLRRDPDALYLNWIQVLDTTGDFRVMVSGFVNSLEYRFRFGP